MADWVLTQTNLIKTIFQKYAKNGEIDGETAANLLTSSRLPFAQLAHIWDLSDKDNDGRLNENEFVLAFQLCICVSKRGLKLPSQLPDTLERWFEEQKLKKPPMFAKAEKVIHTRASDALQRAGVVVGVHSDDVVRGFYYTVRLSNDDHQELQANEERLSKDDGSLNTKTVPEEGGGGGVKRPFDGEMDEFSNSSFRTVPAIISQPVVALSSSSYEEFGFANVNNNDTNPIFPNASQVEEESFGDFEDASNTPSASHLVEPMNPPAAVRNEINDLNFEDAVVPRSENVAQQQDESFGAFSDGFSVVPMPAVAQPTVLEESTFGDFNTPSPTIHNHQVSDMDFGDFATDQSTHGDDETVIGMTSSKEIKQDSVEAPPPQVSEDPTPSVVKKNNGNNEPEQQDSTITKKSSRMNFFTRTPMFGSSSQDDDFSFSTAISSSNFNRGITAAVHADDEEEEIVFGEEVVTNPVEKQQDSIITTPIESGEIAPTNYEENQEEPAELIFGEDVVVISASEPNVPIDDENEHVVVVDESSKEDLHTDYSTTTTQPSSRDGVTNPGDDVDMSDFFGAPQQAPSNNDDYKIPQHQQQHPVQDDFGDFEAAM